MKKSAIAVAVAAALGTSAVAMAETTLYGSARVSVDWTNPDMSDFANLNYRSNSNGGFETINTNKYLQVWNNSSRLGVRGSEDLGSGISAIYQYEFGVNVTGQNDGPGSSEYFNSNRPRWVGLKGDFGALTLGTQFTPYYNVIGYTDTFNSTKTFNRDYFLSGSSTMGNPVFFQKGIAELRRGSSVLYTTPNWSGLSAQGMVTMNGRPGANFVDTWEANLTYSNGPWFAGATYLQDRNRSYGPYDVSDPLAGDYLNWHSHDNQYGAAVGWDNKQFGVGFSWQQYNPDDKVKADTILACVPPVCDPGIIAGQAYERVNAYTLQGTYYFGSEVLRLTGSYMKPSNADTKLYTVEAGFQHNLSKRTRLWLEYIYNKQKFDNYNTIVGVDANDNFVFQEQNGDDSNMHTVSAGIRHDF